MNTDEHGLKILTVSPSAKKTVSVQIRQIRVQYNPSSRVEYASSGPNLDSGGLN